jgi:uncharacterized membrane protein YqgA involved in biofilm formation
VRGIGTVVNVVTVLAGTALGVLAGSRLPERLRTAVLQAVGLVTFIIGGRDAFGTRNIVFPLVALILGAAIGTALRIEDRLESLGEGVRRRFEGEDVGRNPRFVEGFVAASLLFCVGPLTILGSIQDGLGGPDHAQLLLVKAALDGTVAIAFASALASRNSRMPAIFRLLSTRPGGVSPRSHSIHATRSLVGSGGGRSSTGSH